MPSGGFSAGRSGDRALGSKAPLDPSYDDLLDCVTAVSGEDCRPAAPAVATRYLRERHGLPANARNASGENIVSKVSRHMDPGATFNTIYPLRR